MQGYKQYMPVTITGNNQRLASAFNDLDPRLSLLYQVGDDIIRPCQNNLRGMPNTHPKIHSFISAINIDPCNLDFQVVLGVRSSNIESK